MAIIEAVDGTDVITTSRKLQEKGFGVEYDLSKLLEGTRKISPFALVFKTIDDKIRERLGFDKVAEHRKPLADALDLIQKHRIADSMPYFTKKLQKELGIDFVNQSPDPKTPDGFSYAAYDTEGTVNKLKDSVKNETDPEKKANVLAQADGLAARTKELVTKMRSPEYQKEVTNDRDLKMFRNHQAVIYQAKETLRKLKKLEKSGKC